MDLNQMTTKTQEAIMSAQSLAVSHHHQEVDTVHLLFTLLEEQDGLAVRIFKNECRYRSIKTRRRKFN